MKLSVPIILKLGSFLLCFGNFVLIEYPENSFGKYTPSSYKEVEGGFVSFKVISKDNVWATGFEGEYSGKRSDVILCSTDGGFSWKRKFISDTEQFSDIAFPIPSFGIVTGANGVIFKSSDGGESWHKQKLPTTAALSRIEFLNSSIGWIMGYGGELFRTTDSGQSWRESKIIGAGWEGDDFRGWLNTLSFSDEHTGWSVGEKSQFYNSTDGGITWISLTSKMRHLIVEDHKANVDFLDVKFFTSQRGYALAQISIEKQGEIYHKGIILLTTKNGGQTWTVSPVFKGGGVFSTQFMNLNEIWLLVDYGRLILHSTDGGKEWNQNVVPNEVSAPLMYVVDSNHAWLMSTLYGFSGTNLYTSNGGKTWKKQKIRYMTE